MLVSYFHVSFISASLSFSRVFHLHVSFICRKDMLAMYKGRHPMQPDRVKVADMSFKAMQQVRHQLCCVALCCVRAYVAVNFRACVRACVRIRVSWSEIDKVATLL